MKNWSSRVLRRMRKTEDDMEDKSGEGCNDLDLQIEMENMRINGEEESMWTSIGNIMSVHVTNPSL